MRIERTGLQFRMVLNTDEPGMIGDFDRFRQNTVWRCPGENQSAFLEFITVADVDFIPVAMTLRNAGRSIDFSNLGTGLERSRIGTKAHRTAQIAFGVAHFLAVAFRPFGHQADNRFLRRAKLGGIGFGNPGEIARRFQNRHLHAETNSEIRDLAGSGEVCRSNLALGAPLPKTTGNQNSVNTFQIRARVFLLEGLRSDPFKVHLDPVGDTAMDQCFDQRLVGILQNGVLADNRDLDLAFRIGNRLGNAVPAIEHRCRRPLMPKAARTSSSNPSLW